MKYATVFFLFLLSSFAFSDTTFYGSLNVGLEYRDLKNNALMDDHVQLQDAYSYIGAHHETITPNGLTVFAKAETALDLAKGQTIESLQTSWAGSGATQEHIIKFGVTGSQGTLSAGHMWNAYYNAVAVHTDTFSSGWTGFDTYAPFRMNNLISYASPAYGSFSYSVNVQTQVNQDTGNAQDRILMGAAYESGNAGVYVGFDNQGAGDSQLIGLAATYQISQIRLAAKHEILQKGFAGEDGSLTSLQISTTSGANTYRLHVATGEYPSYLPIDDPDGKASEMKLGMTHTLNDSWSLFAEYHQSDEYCAYDVTDGNGNGSYDDAGPDDTLGTGDDILGNEIYGCKVISVGSHFSF